MSLELEADGLVCLPAWVRVLDKFVFAELLNLVEASLLAGENELDGALASDILDLSARENDANEVVLHL